MPHDHAEGFAPPPPAPYACYPSRSRGRLVAEPEGETRSPYQRDRDRIIHSGAFRRLQYKTQVFVVHEGDYFRTRLTHSLEVAQITRSICRALGLNEDLAEAVALAHDLGHTPFGHAGEDALKPLLEGHGGFDHNDQTFRVITQLEQRYTGFDGLNLTWETLEGVVKHNGPLLRPGTEERLPVTVSAFRQHWDLELHGWPSAEAQVAALADDIAYNNHDIDDGLRAGLFAVEDLLPLPLIGPIVAELQAAHPGLQQSRLIHETIRRMINAMVLDLLTETRARLAALDPQSVDDIRAAPRPVVAFSQEMTGYVRQLRRFLWAGVYKHWRVNRMTSKARRVVRDLFTLLHAEPELLPAEWQQRLRAAEGFRGQRSDHETIRARLVTDFIAGMTDRFALLEHARLFDMGVLTGGLEGS